MALGRVQMVRDRNGNWVLPGESGTSPYVGTNNYNLGPAPRLYSEAYGGVPGSIGMPPNLYQGVQSVYPGISGLTAGAGDVIGQQQRAELSPGTVSNIINQAAAFGVKSGLPRTNFSGYQGLRQLGLSSEAEKQKGVENYLRFLSGVSGTVDDPALAAQIATWNATNLSAPDPAAAVKAAEDAYNRAMANAQAAVKPVSPGAGTLPGATGVSRGAGGSQFAPTSEPGPSAWSYATGPFYDKSPEKAAANWQKWASGLGGPTGTTGGGTYYAGELGGEPSWGGAFEDPYWQQMFGAGNHELPLGGGGGTAGGGDFGIWDQLDQTYAPETGFNLDDLGMEWAGMGTGGGNIWDEFNDIYSPAWDIYGD